MATNLLPLRPAVVYASSNPDPIRRRNPSSSSSAQKWWSPLFGWSSEPDYVGTNSSTSDQDRNRIGSEAEADLESKHARSRFSPGCFTAEKAKQLRMLTSGMSSHHDVMYHSAIASRLASDFKNTTSSSSASVDDR